MSTLRNFFAFIRQQGVIGLAIGLILGDAVSKLVGSVVNDLVQPLVGLLLGSKEGLVSVTLPVGGAQLGIGQFASAVIDFIVIAGVVYFIFRGLKLEKLDLKKPVKKKK